MLALNYLICIPGSAVSSQQSVRQIMIQLLQYRTDNNCQGAPQNCLSGTSDMKEASCTQCTHPCQELARMKMTG